MICLILNDGSLYIFAIAALSLLALLSFMEMIYKYFSERKMKSRHNSSHMDGSFIFLFIVI